MSPTTAYGVLALTFMMAMYAGERRGPRYVLGFAAGCGLSSIYAFVAGTWPFGMVEMVWALVAVRRFMTDSRRGTPRGGRSAPSGG
jgi:hypothetical protein